jgi:hypothetical protein
VTFRRVGLDVVASAIALRLRNDPDDLGADQEPGMAMAARA